MNIIERISAVWLVRPALKPRALFALLLTAATLCGCARYDMTLTNGGRVTNVRKPTYNKQGGYYSYVTAGGQTNIVPASRVVSVVPHGDKDQNFKQP